MLGEGEGNGGVGGKIVGERETVKKNGKNTRKKGGTEETEKFKKMK